LSGLCVAPAAAEVHHGSFVSASLERDVPYLVDLPSAYGEGTRYPVIYFLHGLFEDYDFWERRELTAVLRELRSRRDLADFVVVTVSGKNSFFVNSSMGRYEDLVTLDLIPYIESHYDVLPGAEHRALAGISMGGYAALRIAFEYPKLFAAVATHSAMLLQQVPSAAAGAGEWHMRAFGRVFGEPIDPKSWAAADPLVWAEQADAPTPGLYFDCGEQDRYGLARGNQALHAILERRGIPHEFALRPGDHGYEFVRSGLERSLGFLASQIMP
jgi:enterochelin esterase family protein